MLDCVAGDLFEWRRGQTRFGTELCGRRRPLDCEIPSIPVEVALPDDMHFGTRNFIVNIQQLKFENPGLYSIDLLLDGQLQANIPLLVRHNPPAPPA